MHRIWFSVVRFPETLPVDSYVSFPSGSQILWPSAFDWTIAAMIRPFVDPTDQTAVEAIAIWVPAVLGGITAGVVGLLAARAYGRGAAWCAGLIFCFLPMSYGYSHLGMIDHHVAVALFTTLTLWLAFDLFDQDDYAFSAPEALRARSTRIAIAMGFSMAATILIWPGALLHVAILQAAFLFRWLFADSRDAARARAIQFAASQAMVAVCVAPFAVGQIWREYGDWSPLVLSNFQPAYFGCAALAILAVQIVHDRSHLGDARSQRILSALTIGFAAVMVMLILVAPLRDALVYAGRWFTGGEALLALVNETRPILAPSGHFDPSFAVTRFGAGFVILPIVWLYLARRAVTRRDAPQGLLLFWALAFFVLTLQQWRFGNTLAVVYAVLIGASLAEWGSSLPQRIRPIRLRPILEAVVVIALMSWSVISIGGYFVPLVQFNLHALADPVRRERGALLPGKLIVDRAARWIAEETPKTSGYFEPDQTPEYGVLSDWSSGHLVRYRSMRPVVQDNFGPYAGRENFEAAWNYFGESEEEDAIRILERLGVRYVIGGPRGAGSLRGLPSDAMAHRLARDYGSRTVLRSAEPVPGLAHHRLIYYAHTAPPSAQLSRLQQQRPYSSIGLWEIVPGARIEGRAEPNTVVRANLALETESGPRHVYRRETLSDVHGVYRLIVPYPTDVTYSSAIQTQGNYHFSTETGRGRLAVREADVKAGAAVQGPDLTSTK